MNKKLLLFLVIFPLFAFQMAHKFYVSVTEIEFNAESQSLQIISRVFTDDIEKLLKTKYDEEIFLSAGKEHPDANKFLEEYINEKLEIVVNGAHKKLHFIGKEYDKDQLLFYIEVEDVATLNTISVRNEILTGIFPDQKNVVHVEYGDETKSLLLGKDHQNEMLKFSK